MEILKEENGARYIIGLDVENNKLDSDIALLMERINESSKSDQLLNVLLFTANLIIYK
jgi:hypothetical protein